MPTALRLAKTPKAPRQHPSLQQVNYSLKSAVVQQVDRPDIEEWVQDMSPALQSAVTYDDGTAQQTTQAATRSELQV